MQMLWCDESLPKSAEILRFSWNQETKNQDYTEVLGKILVLMRRFFWNQEPRYPQDFCAILVLGFLVPGKSQDVLRLFKQCSGFLVFCSRLLNGVHCNHEASDQVAQMRK